MSSSSNTPCAACKCLRRKCTQECVFAPFFPPEDPQKFTNVHRVFGASNVTKILNELHPNQREETVYSLAYEAMHRIRDPVYGCVSIVHILRHQLKQVQLALENAKKELANYIEPSQMLPLLNQPPGNMAQQFVGLGHYNNVIQPMMGAQQSGVCDNNINQQQILEAQLAAMREQEMFRNFERHHIQENELIRYSNVGFSEVGGNDNNGVTVAMGFNHMPMQSPSLVLASSSYDHQHLPCLYHDGNNNQIQHQQSTGIGNEHQLLQQSDQEFLLIDQHHQINNVGNHNQQLLQLPRQQSLHSQMQLPRAKGEDNQSF